MKRKTVRRLPTDTMRDAIKLLQNSDTRRISDKSGDIDAATVIQELQELYDSTILAAGYPRLTH